MLSGSLLNSRWTRFSQLRPQGTPSRLLPHSAYLFTPQNCDKISLCALSQLPSDKQFPSPFTESARTLPGTVKRTNSGLKTALFLIKEHMLTIDIKCDISAVDSNVCSFGIRSDFCHVTCRMAVWKNPTNKTIKVSKNMEISVPAVFIISTPNKTQPTKYRWIVLEQYGIIEVSTRGHHQCRRSFKIFKNNFINILFTAEEVLFCYLSPGNKSGNFWRLQSTLLLRWVVG